MSSLEIYPGYLFFDSDLKTVITEKSILLS